MSESIWYNAGMKPFKYGCVVTGETFCPRPDLQKRLATCVKDGQNVVLVGERRMGKTSLVYSVCNGLKRYRMMYVDLLNIRTVADFCNRVATAAAQLGKKESFVSRALSFMARLRPTLSVDPGNGMPVVSVDSRMAEDPSSMSDVMALIEKFSCEERMFVVFDEFQEVKKLDAGDQVLAMLRGKIQFLQDTCFVFSGSVRSDMVDIFTNPKNPFFKSAMTISVANIPDDEFAPFLIERFKTGNRIADRAFIDAVFDFTGRTTGDVQQLCAAVWNTTEKGSRLSTADIKPALEEIFEQESGPFELQTTRLTRYQFKVLVALAKLGGRNVYSSEFMSAAEVPSSGTATKALQRLVADGLVFVHDKEYRFFNPFLRAWLINKGY